jgi:hypothetical protein
MIHELLGNISKVLLVLGTVFIITKLVNKQRGDKPDSFHNRNKKLLYQLHVNGSKIGVILGFVHGLTISPRASVYLLTGWFLGIVMLVLLGTGAYLSIKQKSRPMTAKDDEVWRTIRLLKWILTFILFPAIGIHYLLSG